MKARKYMFALLSAALLCSCTDKEDYLVDEAEQNPAQEFVPVSFVATIGDAKTRVEYTEVEGTEEGVKNLKLTWGDNDLIFVYPDKAPTDHINLATTHGEAPDLYLKNNEGDYVLSDGHKVIDNNTWEVDTQNVSITDQSGKVTTGDKTYYKLKNPTGGVTADQGYVFKHENDNGVHKFVYQGYKVSYEVIDVYVEHEVDKNDIVKDQDGVITSYTAIKEYHKVSAMKKYYYYGTFKETGTETAPGTSLSYEDKIAFPSITAAEGKCQARWEHPLNAAGECQDKDNPTEHLKYQEVMIAELSADNLTTGVDATAQDYAGDETNNKEAKPVVFKHLQTVVFKIIMNQFLYSLHEGAHVSIQGIDAQGNEHFIDGVYHQRPDKYFAYNQTEEPLPYLLDLTADTNDPCGYSTESDRTDKTLTSYIMVETSKLLDENGTPKYQTFEFALTDNWSHDLYTWKLSLPEASTFQAGKYYTVDLTNRTCLPALWMGGNVLFSIKNLGATSPQDVGLIYRYGDQVGKTVAEAEALSNSSSEIDYYSKEAYNGTAYDGAYTPVTNKSGMGTAIENFHNSFELKQDGGNNRIEVKSGVTLQVPDFLEQIGTIKFNIKYSDKGTVNNITIPKYVLKNEYDVASQKLGKSWRILYWEEFGSNYTITLSGETGFIQENSKTYHKLYYPQNKLYKDKSTINTSGYAILMCKMISVFVENPTFITIIRLENDGNINNLNTRYHFGTPIRPVREPLHTLTHVSSEAIVGSDSGEEAVVNKKVLEAAVAEQNN